MDAVKFLKEWRRICRDKNCVDCILSQYKNGKDVSCGNLREQFPETAVELVEKWSVEHPPKTRLKELIEKYPNVQLEEDGSTPKVCAVYLGYSKDCPKSMDCQECWNMPVEE